MIIIINGREREVAEGISIADLLIELGVKGPFAVELNRKVCPKTQHNQTRITSGDVLEIVTIVGGG